MHQLEAGVWLQRIQANDNLAQYQYGQASFGSLASFLRGAVSTFMVIPSPTPLGWRSLEAAGFGIYRMLLDNLDYRLDQTAPFDTTQTLKNVPLSQLHIAPGSQLPSGGLISPSGIQPDAYTPTILTWTFKVQQEIAPNTVLTAGYVGSHGYHEILSLDANEPFPSYSQSGTISYPKNALLANPKLANTTSWFSEGLSSFNALELNVNRRFSQGLQLRAAYTYSKSLDDGTAWNSSVASNAPGFVMYPLIRSWTGDSRQPMFASWQVLTGRMTCPLATESVF